MDTKSGYEGEPIAGVRHQTTSFTPRCRDVAAIVLCLVAYLFCCMTYSALSPFYPIDVEKKGLSPTIVGAIMSVSPACPILLSPLIGIYLPKLGTKFTLIAGIVFHNATFALFAALSSLSGTLLTVLSFSLVFVGGVGSAMLQTSMYAILGMLSGGRYGLVMGLAELAAGLGYVTGGPLAGILYQIGGFQLPFFVIGLIPLAFIPPIYVIIISPTDNTENDKLSVRVFCSAINSIQMCCIVLAAVVGSTCMSFSAPIFSVFAYNQFHLSVLQIGLIGLIDAGIYTILCLVMGPIYDKLPPKFFMILGLLLSSIGCFTLGPAPYIASPHLWITLVADGVLGFGIAFTMGPVYSAMMEVARKQFAELSTQSITMFVSGIIPSAVSVGEVIGPVVSGKLSDSMEFEEISAVFGEVSLAMAVLLLLVITIDHFWPKPHAVIKEDTYQQLNESKEFKKDYKSFNKKFDTSGTYL